MGYLSVATTILVAGCSFVLSAPFTELNGDFTIQQTAQPRAQWRSPAASYAEAILKFEESGLSQQEADTLRSESQRGTFIAVPEPYDEEYLSPITVGGKVLNVAVDSASADLWVFSAALPAEAKKGHEYYTPGPGSRKLVGSSWNIGYGDGTSAGGDVYVDRVTVGGVTATSQAVQAATSISPLLVEDINLDGIMGLGFSAINTVKPQKQLSFFDNVRASLTEPIFTAALKHRKPGSYDFGFIDHSKYRGKITYSPVYPDEGNWYFNATGYAVGKDSQKSNLKCLVDTGTTYLLLPAPYVDSYYARVPGATRFQNSTTNSWVFPCNTRLPSFSIIVENKYHATVPPEHINFKPMEPGSNMCFGGIQATNTVNFGILGDVFLKSQFVVFDHRGPRVGFAAQR